MTYPEKIKAARESLLVTQEELDTSFRMVRACRSSYSSKCRWYDTYSDGRCDKQYYDEKFRCCGILIGILLYCSRIADAALFPLLSAAQTMPLISIAPLFLIWFGFEISGKIVIVAVFGLFPIAVQTVRGLEAVPQFYSDVALTCGATRAWTLWHVKLRVAARQIYGGIRVSAAYIFATATTAEYLGARKGLGIWLQAAYNSFRTPLIFSATLVIIVITGILMCLVNLSERLLLGPADADADPDADQ